MKKILIFCFVSIALKAFSQNVPKTADHDKEATILFSSTFSQSGYRAVMSDTLFVRNSFVLEPIRMEVSESSNREQNKVTKAPEEKLKWFFITDLLELTGMGFDLEQEDPARNIRTFDSKSKSLGFGFTPEPFIFDKGYRLEDYKRVRDTTINGQACFVVMANKAIRITNNSQDDYLLFTRMVINPQIKDQIYPFISKLISEHFGGAIVSVESRYKSGLSLSTKYQYKSGLDPKHRILFDKYQSLYFSNLDLLKKYRKKR